MAKGLDFDNVTLVGVVDADLSLYAADFRAGERTFSLITQVVGRGRPRGEAGESGDPDLHPGQRRHPFRRRPGL